MITHEAYIQEVARVAALLPFPGGASQAQLPSNSPMVPGLPEPVVGLETLAPISQSRRGRR
jgi:hypothetical protein